MNVSTLDRTNLPRNQITLSYFVSGSITVPTADLLIEWFVFDRTSKSVVDSLWGPIKSSFLNDK